jgi:hypothetical protein
MKTYHIPVSWSVGVIVDIEAENIGDAIDIAYQGDLPEKSEYMDDSFAVDVDLISLYNEGEEFEEENDE